MDSRGSGDALLWSDPDDRRPLTATLERGLRVLVRPIAEGDAAALAEGYANLSEGSRFFRFLSNRPPLTPLEVTAFTTPDRITHDAIGAAILDGPNEVPAGVVRYYTIGRMEAEFALTVVDHSQANGLGTLLLGLLASVAAGRGIKRFRATVHPRNRGMRHILNELGAEWMPGTDGGEVILPLCADPRGYPRTNTGARFRAMHALRRLYRADAPDSGPDA